MHSKQKHRVRDTSIPDILAMRLRLSIETPDIDKNPHGARTPGSESIVSIFR
jgi:hypothetical protein